jgi:hypothetical protein
MLMIAALLLAGFVAGVALTASVALFVFGLLHADAVRIVDSHLAGIALPAGGPVVTMRSSRDD